MKKMILSLLLAFASNFLFAIDYYISNTGNDANNGTSPTTAWATINKLNSSWGSIVSGDRILFERGGTFFGSINVTKSGITLGSFGTGAKPIITGFYTIPSWTSAGTNLWTATIPTSLNNIRMLTINDRVTRVGRFPNYVDGFSAWIRYTNVIPSASPATVTSATAINTNLADGELVLYKFNWNLDVMPINSIAGNNITCTNPAGLYGIASGGASYGGLSFFVQNSINALDQNNEWHFRNSTKVLTIFSPTNPSDRVTKIATVQTLVSLGSNSNITIDGLDIQGATEKGIVSTGGSNVTIRNCVVKCIQGWGIDMRAGNALIQNNLVRDIGSNGIWIGSSATVTGNALRSVGAVEGLPGLTNSGAGTQGNQDDQHEGLLLQSSNGITCTFNEFDSIGYNAIKHAGSNIRMEKNFIKFPCVTKSDGGGIYCWDVDGTVARTNRIIKNNIIVNSNKFLYGTSTPGSNTQGYGIYFDGGTNGGATGLICDSNVIAPSNFSQNSACSPTNTTDDGGFMMNNPRNLFIRNNIVFGWPDAMEIWRWPSMPDASGNRIVNNAFYVNNVGSTSDLCTQNQSFQYHEIASSTQAVVQTQVQNIGVIDSNFVNDNAIACFISKNQSWNTPMKLAAWRTYSGKDANTRSFPNTTPDFQYNATNSPVTYSFPGLSKIDFRGVVHNNSAVIPPFYGNIFFPNGSAPSGNAPVVTATATTITCNGGSSTVTVSATGGTPPYTGTGAFTRTAGTYTFTVTDANNVSGSTTITINQPSELTAGNPTAPAITTVGGTTTITQPVPTGGTAPYQYQLGTGVFQGANTFSGVVAGTYTITIRDACSTTITRSITIAPFTAPAYQARIISVNYGASTWAQNETRNVTVTIQNTGTATWTDGSGTTRDINVAIKWNGWSDYHSRTDAHPCAPGETRTYTLSIRAANATQSASGTGNINNVTPVYSTPLALGTNNLTIDLVNERACWFANNNGGCGPGNTRFVTPTITIVSPPANVLNNLGLTSSTPSAAAYSLRKLSSDYNGPVLRIRRSSDGELRDVYFNTSGVLALNSTVSAAGGGVTTATTLGSWIGVNSGTVAIWYDQSGLIRDISAAVANQPLIIQSGSILTNAAGQPRVQFNGSTTYLTNSTFVPTTQPVSLSGVWQFTSLTSPGAELCGWGRNAGTGSRIGAWINFVNSTQGRFGIEIAGASRIGSTVINANSWNITNQVISTNDISSLSQRVNGLSETVTGNSGVLNITASGSVFAVGTVPAALGVHTLNGNIQELVLFQSGLSTTDRITMETNQSTYYIPAPSPIVVTATQTGNITCNGGTTTVTVSATGGTPPYTGTGTFTRTAGTQTFTVTDATGAAGSTTLTIIQPTQLVVTADATPITCVGGSSTITMGATGGTPPYTGTGTFTRVAGVHSLVVTDASGCSVTTGITLTDPTIVIPIISIGSVQTPTILAKTTKPILIRTVLQSETGLSAIVYPNPSQDYFNLDLKTKSKKNVSVFVYTSDGKLIFQVTGAPRNRYKFGEFLPNGIYIVKVIQGKDERIIEIMKG